jgi:DNA-binding response OmpR family regulator
MKEAHSVLLIEDDPAIARSLKMGLPYQGFQVTVCETLAQARMSIRTQAFEIILLDLNLPDGDGLEICREIRKSHPLLPIIMVTAKTDETSAVQGIREGADDYVRKPFGVLELCQRMKRLLERRQSEENLPSFGPLKVDLKKRRAWANDREIILGKRGFEILALLIQKQGEVVTRDDIFKAVGETVDIYDRTLDSHLSQLRKKIKDAGAAHILISPVYGVGYRLQEESSHEKS